MTAISHKKNYLLTLSSSFMVTGCTAIIGFLTVPISLSYWQTEKYGIWSLLTSLLVYLTMTNLGLNSAATTLISKNPDPGQKLILFRRALLIMLLCLLLFGGGFLALNLAGVPYVQLLGKIPVSLTGETQRALFVMGIFFFVNMPFTLFSSVIVGFQAAYIENLFSLLQLFLNFVSLLLVVSLKGDLPAYAALNGAFLLLVNCLRGIYCYRTFYRKSARACEGAPPAGEDLRYGTIVHTGKRFLFMGVAAMVVWNTDNFVISHYLGVSAVTTYSVVLKLYTVLYSVLFVLNGSAMSLLAKEFGAGNWEWINRVYAMLLIFATVVGGLTWLGGVFFARDFIALWTGDRALYAGLLTTGALGCYAYLMAMSNLNSGVIATFNFTKHAPWAGWLEAAVKLGASILLLRVWGVGGVALGTVLGSLLAPTWIMPLWLVQRSGRRLDYNVRFVLRHLASALLPFLLVGVLTQLYVNAPLGRVLIGVISLTLYLAVSLHLMPRDAVEYLKSHLTEFLARLKSQRPSVARS